MPEIIKGTKWISTRRQSHPDWMTDLTFTAMQEIDVFIVADAIQGKSLNSDSQWISPRWLVDQGFKDTSVRGQWRGNYFLLKDFVIMKRTIKQGEQLILHPRSRAC